MKPIKFWLNTAAVENVMRIWFFLPSALISAILMNLRMAFDYNFLFPKITDLPLWFSFTSR